MNAKALLDFVTQVQADRLGVEAIAVADEQRLLFEHHFVPGFARNIYSHTKSFTSTAVGFAISEGLCLLTTVLRHASRSLYPQMLILPGTA